MQDFVNEVVADFFSSFSSLSKEAIAERIECSLRSANVNVLSLTPSQRERLKLYVASRFSSPGLRVGVMSAQAVMHEATQSQLSAFHTAGLMKSDVDRLYLPSGAVLEMRETSDSMCVVSPSVIRDVELVYVGDLILETFFTEWKGPQTLIDPSSKDLLIHVCDDMKLATIRLDKKLMRKFMITMSMIRPGVLTEKGNMHIRVSPNYDASIYVHYKKLKDLYEFRSGLQRLPIDSSRECRGSREVVAGDRKLLVVKPKYLSVVVGHEKVDKSSVFCNDVAAVHENYGICSARDLIYETLKAQGGVNDSSCMLVADYMTWSGSPKAFTKNDVKGEYGPLFDMYYERPRDSLIEWVVDGKKDVINNPYTSLMVGARQ